MVVYHHVIGATATTVAFLLNSFLLFIIVKYSSDKLGIYKHFLFVYTLNAVYYCVIQFLLLENFYVPDVEGASYSAFMFFSTVAIVPKFIQTWVLTSFVGSYDFNLLIVCWSFLYRYSIVSESNLFKSTPKMCGLFLFSFLIWLLEAYNIVAIHPTAESDEFLADTVFNVTGNNISDIGYIGGPFFWKDDSFNYTLVICLFCHGGYYTGVSVFVGILWVKIRHGLAVMQCQTERKFNQKIYILLTLQTIFPIVFNSSPVVITFVCAAMRWYVGDRLLITGALLSFAQVLDPICIMMMVNDYKQAIMKRVLSSRVSSMYRTAPAPSVG